MTDAIMNGLPPHIAQLICGHKSLDTTMGYKAIYPAEAIEAHRAFIARRRATRPSDECRTPTEEEWDALEAAQVGTVVVPRWQSRHRSWRSWSCDAL
ncbi:hypothetical protein [Streptomyces sp. NBC_00576]|uniref:hypothetical protein n=1 Tax=Streptomyces sp. NBC_00576 TaxID=2903665 RepID=UPI003FCDBEA7